MPQWPQFPCLSGRSIHTPVAAVSMPRWPQYPYPSGLSILAPVAAVSLLQWPQFPYSSGRSFPTPVAAVSLPQWPQYSGMRPRMTAYVSCFSFCLATFEYFLRGVACNSCRRREVCALLSMGGYTLLWVHFHTSDYISYRQILWVHFHTSEYIGVPKDSVGALSHK